MPGVFAMTLIQELMKQASKGGLLNIASFNRFSPTEIRETIQTFRLKFAKPFKPW